MSERVNIIIFIDPPVVVFWKGKFFYCLSEDFMRIMYIILFSYEVVMYLDLFVWKNNINLIDG